MTEKRKPTTNALEILHRRYYEGQPERIKGLEEARANAEIARRIYDLRTEAGLTQQALAKRVGTSASVISRLEDDDYEGHSLTLLRRIAEALGYVGVLTVEFFAASDGPIVNEIAPRVHNSGHWTIEGAATSQFEQHIRAICGLPLGSTALRAGGAVMDNLIGDEVLGWQDLVAREGASVHLYGKGTPRPGRKMGHVTQVETAGSKTG